MSASPQRDLTSVSPLPLSLTDRLLRVSQLEQRAYDLEQEHEAAKAHAKQLGHTSGEARVKANNARSGVVLNATAAELDELRKIFPASDVKGRACCMFAQPAWCVCATKTICRLHGERCAPGSTHD